MAEEEKKEEKKEILHPRENNKTNRARREKENKQIKLLKLVGIILLAVVVVLLIGALVYGKFIEPKKTIATVGEDKITVDEFKQAVSYQRANMINNYEYYQQIYAMFGMPMDENTTNSYRMQLAPEYKTIMGIQVLSDLVNKHVLDYGAQQEGITVSDEEVEQEYKSMFSYHPEGTATPAPTDEPFAPTPTVSQEQLDILRYTATPEPTEVPETEEVVEEAVEAEEPVEEVAEEAVEVEEAVEEVAEEAVEAEEPVEEPAEEVVEETEPEPTVAPTEYTEEMYNMHQDVYFANNYYFSKDFFRKQLYYELLKDKVEDNLKLDIPRETDMVWARHILVETPEEAQAVIDRLNAGEEWGDLVTELSKDTGTVEKGGDLGWFAEGTMVQAFNDAAFAQEVGTISEEPVVTDYGAHVIQVIGHEVHPYTSTEYSNAVDQAYYQWLEKYSEEVGVDSTYEVDKYTPVEPAFNY